MLRKMEEDFPGSTVDENPPVNAGDMGLIPGPGRSHGTAKPVRHNYWAPAVEPLSCSDELMHCNYLSPCSATGDPHHSEKPAHCNKEQPLLPTTRGKPTQRMKSQYSNSRPSSWWCHPSISPSVVPSPPTFNLSQHQSLSKWVNSLHQVAKVWEFQLQHSSTLKNATIVKSRKPLSPHSLAVLLTVFLIWYMMSPWLIYAMIGSLYLLIPFI